jgi:hypothetical protein
MTRVYSEVELDRQQAISSLILDAMNAEPDYDMLAAVMSAHVQRMICDRALQGEDAHNLLAGFLSACTAKVEWWIDMRKAVEAA